MPLSIPHPTLTLPPVHRTTNEVAILPTVVMEVVEVTINKVVEVASIISIIKILARTTHSSLELSVKYVPNQDIPP